MMKKKTILLGAVFLFAALLCGTAMGAFFATIRDLPQIRALEDFSPSAVTRIYSADDVLLAELYKKRRDPVPLTEIPVELRQALLATEDRQFYEHSGIDLKGIARAIVRDIMAGGFVEGASTITQQLAKTLFLTPEKTLERKLKEAFLAFQLERRYTKDEILELYLNQIYLGSGAYGVQAAARKYFGRPVNELDLAECALIAGLPKAPSAYSPLVNPELAIKRRNLVLRQMLAVEAIDMASYEAAKSRPYLAVEAEENGTRAPYFIDHVRKLLENEIGSARLYSGGLTIETTLRFPFQLAAEEAIENGLAELCMRMAQNGISKPSPQAALIAIDVKTGEILSMIGGSDYRKTPYNRATLARRQPGSAFKPIVYARAVEQGFSQNSLLLDAPVAFQGSRPGVVWRPENFSESYQGEMTFRKALTHSENIPAVRLIEKLGPANVISFARSLGIDSALSADLSLALGTSEMTLEELTCAYAVFANQGERMPSSAIRSVQDKAGRLIWQPAIRREAVMSEAGAAIMVDMLRGVVAEGTGRHARKIDHPVGGKTGTTNSCRDALFVGFSPTIAAGVWVGCDDYRSLGPRETGGRAALPIWAAFMESALAGQPFSYFPVPDGLVKRYMDPDTGDVYNSSDRAAVAALFREERQGN